jgi:hypothetical protein
MSATNPAWQDEPADYEVMGVWVAEAMEAHPSIRAGAKMRPLVMHYAGRVEASFGEHVYSIESDERREWWEPATERHARQLADELLIGLREVIRQARKETP